MRRGCSAILFVVGGWILTTVALVGLMPVGTGVSPWAMVAVFACIAAPFLLIATWVSPGRRLAELGLTLMISAGVALTMVMTMAAVAFDPGMQRFMTEPMPAFDFTSLAMIVSILLIGGCGYVLRRWGMKATP